MEARSKNVVQLVQNMNRMSSSGVKASQLIKPTCNMRVLAVPLAMEPIHTQKIEEVEAATHSNKTWFEGQTYL